MFLFPESANLPPSMTFPQGLGSVEYTLNVLLKGKKKFGSTKKWASTLVLKVEISRRAIGARLETMAIADALISKTQHRIMVYHISAGLLIISLSTLVLSSLVIQITILRCTFLRVCYRFTLLKLPSSSGLPTKLSVGIIEVHQWWGWFVVLDKLKQTFVKRRWNVCTLKLQKLVMKVWRAVSKSTESS